jgi:SNF2 family DNA or RNA helicase
VALLFTMLICIKQSCCHAELVPEIVRELAAVAHEKRDEIDDPLVLLKMMKTPDDVDNKKRKKLGLDFDPRSLKIVALLEQIDSMQGGEKVRPLRRGSQLYHDSVYSLSTCFQSVVLLSQGVVFSQFTSYLDIVEKALMSANHTFPVLTVAWTGRSVKLP